MKTCVMCKGRLEAVTVGEVIDVDGHAFAARIPAARCTSCRETFIGAEDLAAFETAVAVRLADAGASSPGAFRFMRKAVGLKASDLAALLDVTAETMSRWENGKLPIPRAPAALLGAMVRDAAEGRTVTRDALARLGNPRKLGKRVRVTVKGAA